MQSFTKESGRYDPSQYKENDDQLRLSSAFFYDDSPPPPLPPPPHSIDKSNGRLDLSFTKCNFPKDYLPYVSRRKDFLMCGANSEDVEDELKPSPLPTMAELMSKHHFTLNTSPLPSTCSLEQSGSGATAALATAAAAAGGGNISAPFTASSLHQSYGAKRGAISSHHHHHLASHLSPMTTTNSPGSSSTASSSILATHLLYPFAHRSIRPNVKSSPGPGCFWAKSCGCCVLIILGVLILITLSLVLGFSLYLAIVTNLIAKSSFVYSISGNFKVTSGDSFTLRLLNQTSPEFVKRAARYETIVQHILHSTSLDDAILHSDIYTFRQGSLIVYFRFFAYKNQLDQLLDLKKSKTVINLYTIENVYVEDRIVMEHIREILHRAFRNNRDYLQETFSDLEIDVNSVKIVNIERLEQKQYDLILMDQLASKDALLATMAIQDHAGTNVTNRTESLAQSSPPHSIDDEVNFNELSREDKSSNDEQTDLQSIGGNEFATVNPMIDAPNGTVLNSGEHLSSQANITTNTTAKPDTRSSNISQEFQLSKFTLPFGGFGLRDIATLVINKLSSEQSPPPPPAEAAEDLPETPAQNIDPELFDGLLEAEPRAETEDESLNDTTTTVKPEVESTSTITPTTLPPPSITTEAVDNSVIDGFDISDRPSMNTSEVIYEDLFPNTSNDTISTTTRVPIISNEFFDLYPMDGSNSTSLSVEEEFKVISNGHEEYPTVESITAIYEQNVTEVGEAFEEPKNEFENEFTLHPVDGASGGAMFGNRISKKISILSANSKHDYSSHLNSVRIPPSKHHLDDDERIQFEANRNSSVNIEIGTPETTTTTTTTTTTSIMCEASELYCKASEECMPLSNRCNRVVDCPDYSDEQNCLCADYLYGDETHRHKICDGIVDCMDRSDEIHCPRCTAEMFVCSGQHSQCVEMDRVCDGENDCVNGDDEQNCIALRGEDVEEEEIGKNFNPSGVLYVRHHGVWAPICFDHYDIDSENLIHSHNQSSNLLSMLNIDDMGQAVCRANYYTRLETAQVVSHRNQTGQPYFAISSNVSADLQPSLSLWSSLFEPAQCTGHRVAQIECSSLECGIRPVNPKLRRRIIGGQSSSLGSWPWQVALYREGEFQCGAVVIDNLWLLTAAHCFYSSPDAHWTARAGVLRRGSLYRTYQEEIRQISQIIIHPHYVDKGFVNDIALLKMDRPLQFSKFIRPICLPSSEDSVEQWQNQLCTTVGWGKLYEHGRIFPDTLQEVKLPIISTEQCRKRTLFLPLYKITDNMFCAGFENGGRDACLGDSGGPMMCQKSNGKWILLGITSNGDGCGRESRPGVYTKVSNFIDWINNIISGANQRWSRMAVSRVDSTCPGGHRCPLGKCVKQSQMCDNIIDCEDSSDETNCAAVGG